MANNITLNQVVYIEITATFSGESCNLVPYFISKVNNTNVHALPLKHQAEYSSEANVKRFDYAKVVFNPKNLKVIKSPSFYKHKVYLSEADYQMEQQQQQRKSELYAQALEKLKSLTTQELEKFVNQR